MKQPEHLQHDHSHWDGFDEDLEMLEFNRLQIMCSRGELVVDGDWERLIRIAHSAGNADADTFLSHFGSEGSNDTPYQAANREMFDDFQNGEYWSAIDRSERILADASGSESNREFARKVCGLMRDAYERGRSVRIEQDTASHAPTP